MSSLNDYSKKSVEQLRFIINDAGVAIREFNGQSPEAEVKYMQQILDAIAELSNRCKYTDLVF